MKPTIASKFPTVQSVLDVEEKKRPGTLNKLNSKFEELRAQNAEFISKASSASDLNRAMTCQANMAVIMNDITMVKEVSAKEKVLAIGKNFSEIDKETILGDYVSHCNDKGKTVGETASVKSGFARAFRHADLADVPEGKEMTVSVNFVYSFRDVK